MTTQHEINQGMLKLLQITITLLKEADKTNDNFKIAQSLIRQAYFKYLDLADCPFRQTCINELIANGYVRDIDD